MSGKPESLCGTLSPAIKAKKKRENFYKRAVDCFHQELGSHLTHGTRRGLLTTCHCATGADFGRAGLRPRRFPGFTASCIFSQRRKPANKFVAV